MESYEKKTDSRFSLSAVSLSLWCRAFVGHVRQRSSLLAWLCQERDRAVAHAARGAQCRDDGGDDRADDLEDGFPRFLVVLHDK